MIDPNNLTTWMITIVSKMGGLDDKIPIPILIWMITCDGLSWEDCDDNDPNVGPCPTEKPKKEDD